MSHQSLSRKVEYFIKSPNKRIKIDVSRYRWVGPLYRYCINKFTNETAFNVDINL